MTTSNDIGDNALNRGREKSLTKKEKLRILKQYIKDYKKRKKQNIKQNKTTVGDILKKTGQLKDEK